MSANVWSIVLLSAVLLIPIGGLAQTDPDAQIDLTLGGAAPMPTDGASAVKTIPQRQQAVIAFIACGTEVQFLAATRSWGDKHASSSTGDAINTPLAKMYWYAGLPDSSGAMRLAQAAPCTQRVLLKASDVPPDEIAGPPIGNGLVQYASKLNSMVGMPDLTGQGLNADFASNFGEDCNQVITKVTLSDGVYTINYSVSSYCLREEFNTALQQVYVTGQMGTGAGMPCGVFKTLTDADGNWDFSTRALMRALYLDRLYVKTHGSRIPLLFPDVRDYIREKLIIADINLGQADYAITGCGDTENAQGSATDRVDDPGFFQQVGDDLGGFLDWLIKHWYVAVPALFPPLAAADPIIVAAVDTAVATDAVIQSTRVPETENHRLMIESSRYLNNQLIRDDLTRAEDTDRLNNLNHAQKDVHDWLLQRLQSILLTDFTEYNARPYQSFSIGAVLNLYDFADDPEMSAAARLVLEYAVAKFAIGSNQGRRLVPFRRHMSDVPKIIEAGQNVMFTANEADHQEALALLYSGQTQQLSPQPAMREVLIPVFPPPPPLTIPFAPTLLAGEAIFAAMSWYQPNELVLDLGIRKSDPYFQRFRHGGAEAYSSGRGFLITAGGVITDYSSSILGMGQADDRGAAVPTTIMFPSGINQATMWNFLQFQGLRVRVQGVTGDPAISYDHNLCVTRGFVCGLNLWIPPDIQACLVKGPGNWSFFDTTSCDVYKTGPPVYVALYQKPCLAAADHCNTFGFLEAVDVAAPSAAAFQQFQSGVVGRNPDNLIPDAPAMVAGGGGINAAVSLPCTYFATDGRKIEFDPTANILDSNKTGLTAINGAAENGWKDWGTADGDLVDKNDWPLVHIKNPRYPGKAVTLDFRGWGVANYVGP